MLTSRNEKALYPLIAVASSVIVLLSSLFLAPRHGYLYLLAVAALEAAFGMGRYLVKILPVAVLLGALYFAINYLITHSVADGIAGATRIAGLCIAVVPGMSIPPVNLTRALNELKCPRAFSMGILITLRFFPMLGMEIRTIRESMRTRGADHSIAMLYRSTILPFCVRLVNISDLLALSVETRGFSTDSEYTVWKEVRAAGRDYLYLALTILLCIASIILLPGVGVAG